MPRSGTTWLSQIFASSPDVRLKFCPLFSYEFKHALDASSSPDAWKTFFQNVYDTPSPFMDQDHLRKDGHVPEFPSEGSAPDHLIIKSNRFHHLTSDLLQKVTDVKIIHLVRHPAATLHSWLTNPTEFPDGAEPLLQWRSGDCRKTDVGEYWGFDDWKTVTLQALELERSYPDRFRIQRYDALKQRPLSEAQSLFHFLDISMGPDTVDFIEQSQSRHDPSKRSVFKEPGPDTAWKSGLHANIIEDINSEIRHTPLQRFAEQE
ncbi:Sulfotransferase domain protein [Ruegeria atlantica]|uniref:Sulfotransferase domain protein n=2 Tax=Ruegeria atlantica TaxID=81569 RepID=A0A0P1EHP4_9RHOB|nr:Sulfotransferase domain protein [Ruegeria atlantica]